MAAGVDFCDEPIARALVDEAVAFDAMEGVFASMARGDARNCPVVREAPGHADALRGFRSGMDTGAMTLGLEAGGCWPHSAANGLTSHQSTVLLFDLGSGRPDSVVSGN